MSKINIPRMSVTNLLGPNFEIDPRRSIGATQSGHGVEFGRYNRAQVAAKPYFGRSASEKARYEERITRDISKAGFFTLRVIGVIDVKRADAAVLLTQYEEGVVGGNALSLESPTHTSVGLSVMRAIESVAVELGTLHSQQFTHGDSHTRNFGFRTGGYIDQQPLLFDLEKAAAHGDNDPNMGGAVKNDLSKLAYSLGRRRYGGPDIAAAKRNFISTVAVPYAETYVHLGNPPSLIPVIETATDKFVETFNQQPRLAIIS